MKFIFIDVVEHELHVGSIVFENYNNKINIIVGTTLGYLIKYKNIELYKLSKNLVLNNKNMHESIIDIELVDLKGDNQ